MASASKSADSIFYGLLDGESLCPPLLARGNEESYKWAQKILDLYKEGQGLPLSEQLSLEAEYREGAWPDLWAHLLDWHMQKQLSSPPGVSFYQLGALWGDPELLRDKDPGEMKIEEDDLRALALLPLRQSSAVNFLRRRMVLSSTPLCLDTSQMRKVFMAREDTSLDLLAREMLARYLSAVIRNYLQSHFDVSTSPLAYAKDIDFSENATLHLLPDPWASSAACQGTIEEKRDEEKRGCNENKQEDSLYAAWAEAPFLDQFNRCPDCLLWSSQKENRKQMKIIEKETSLAPKDLLSEEACLDIDDECRYYSSLRMQLRTRLAEESPCFLELSRLLYQQALGAAVRVISQEMERRPGHHLLSQLLPEGSSAQASLRIEMLSPERKEEFLLTLFSNNSRSSVALALSEEVAIESVNR